MRRSLTLGLVAAACAVGSFGGALRRAIAGSPKKTGAPEIVLADVGVIQRALVDARTSPGVTAVLVNVWATWCEPCKEEMPDILKFSRDAKGRGVRVLLVSADSQSERAAVARYLKSLGVTFPTYLKTGDDMDFINGLDPAWDGTIPASWLFNAAGQRAQHWNGKVSYQELMDRLNKLTAEKKSPSPSPPGSAPPARSTP
jgi:thiol-disulfide isomerase/thioredoxin